MRRRTIQTPIVESDFSGGRGRSMWKRVLPETGITYKTDDGRKRRINFDRKYHEDLVASYKANALDQTPFMLADRDNAHTMDFDRQRGTVKDMRYAAAGDELEPGIVADESGLWTKIEFPSRRFAKRVRDFNLGVSARIREGIDRVDGKVFPRAVIHVLGTLDPKITGLGAWKPAVDLSNYDDGQLLDLSNKEITDMPKLRRRRQSDDSLDFATMTEEDVAKLNPDDVEGWSDEELAAFMERFGHLDPDASSEDDDEEDDDDLEDEADEDDEDDLVDDEEDEDTSMSNRRSGRRDIALARADEALSIGRQALTRAEEAEWKAKRDRLIRDGVPPAALDLARPILGRLDGVVIDFSNTTGGGGQVDAGEIVTGLVDMLKGTIDFAERGYEGEDDGADDVDKELHAEFDAAFGHLGI